jgi:putative tricarboxylic transport membrane protein
MRKDLVASIGLLLIAAAYYAATLTIQQSTLEDEIGPTGLPTVLAALLAIIAVVIGARALMTAPAAAAPLSDKDKDPEAPWPRAVGILLLGWLYLPVASIVGYPLALLTLLVAIALYEGMKPSIRMFVVAIGGAVFFWLLFEVVLGVRQPEGILF